ncbi:MarR family winged helix-turn-helix transcriptional regulator [Paenibacillus hodogayensis]|uniref:MarR family winged helix-turn-helix transcriptional regulator n=1 Tax=Paenibacillus hodogayensis TaxID=279208 RepID=A0ABV5VYP8_9BACL
MTDDLQRMLLHPPVQTQAFFALVETTAGLVGISEKYWHSKGLNGARIRLLAEIAKAGGTLLPSVLARRIGVTKPNITVLLAPLEKDGLVARAAHPQDGRKTVVSITEAGEALLLDHLPGNRQTIADAMQGLEEDEQRQLIRLLDKLNRTKSHSL